MHRADNDATAVMERPVIGDAVGRADPKLADNQAIVGADSPQQTAETDKVGSGNVTTRFQSGNQLWRRRLSPDARKNRQALREAFHKALTPDKMAKAVRRMLAIINADDKKAAVAAFKVLTEAAGIKAESDSTKSGPSFTFILPGPGAIPERATVPEVVAEAVPVLPGE